MMGEQLQQTISRYFDNSLENIGRGNSVSLATSLSSCLTSWSTSIVLKKVALIKRHVISVHLPRPSVGSGRHGSFQDVQR